MTQRATFIECPFCTDPMKVKVAEQRNAFEGGLVWYRLAGHPYKCPGCHREFPGGIELTQQELAQAFQEGG